jgi:D-threo-aldose 1-dehydrogenase
MEKRPLGKTDLFITPLCWGCAPLGNMPDDFGYEVSAEKAQRILEVAFQGPVNFLDTAHNYGKSEIRIGEVLRNTPSLIKDYIIATKADRDPVTNQFTASRIRESVEESLRRLNFSPLPLVYLHDPEKHPMYMTNPSAVMEELLAPDGAVAELEKMKEEGLILNIGISGGPINMLIEFIKTGRFNVVITHNRWNLLFQTAEPLLEVAIQHDVAVVNAAPFMSGVFINQHGKFAYKEPTEFILKKVLKMKQICGRYNIPLVAAALQFSLRDSRITSTVIGISDSDQIAQNIALSKILIPEEFWTEIHTIGVINEDPDKF